MTLRLLLAAVALAACHHSAIESGYHVSALVLPRSAANDATNVAACKGPIALVPTAGGIAAAGQGWVMRPGASITSVACDEDGDVFYLAGSLLTMRGHDGQSTTVDLPAGTWRMAGTVDPFVWVYGTAADGHAAIYRVEAGKPAQLLYQGSGSIQTAAAIGIEGVAAVVDGELLAWRGAEIEDFGRVGDADGLAVGVTGAVYISGRAGVAKLTALDKPPEQVAKVFHGPLGLRGDTLFILSREHRSVLQLEPGSVRYSLSMEGPAWDRKSSLDLGFDYGYSVQTSALTYTGDPNKMVQKLVLADAVTMQAYTFDFGAALTRHWTLDARFTYLTGGSSAIMTDQLHSGVGTPLMTSNVGGFTFGMLFGRRIPWEYTSLRFGSGIVGDFMFVDAFRGNDGMTGGPFVGGGHFPLWVRYEWEPKCKWGLYARASLDIPFAGPPPSVSIAIGGDMRVLRECF